MPLHMDDTGELEGEAPKPIDADSVSRGSFDRLGEGQGAVSASQRRARHAAAHHAAAHHAAAHHAAAHHAAAHHAAAHASAEPTQSMDKRTLAIIGGAAALAIVVIVAVFIGVLNAPASTDNTNVEVEQTAVSVDQSILSRGALYTLEEQDGKYSLVETHEADGGQRVSLGEIPGVPAGLVLYDGALIIPENLSDGTWDVMAFTIGSGWGQMMDQDGNVTSGQGTVSEVTLEGSTMALMVDGQRVEVPLVW